MIGASCIIWLAEAEHQCYLARKVVLLGTRHSYHHRTLEFDYGNQLARPSTTQ